jgi:hypothetical protein
LVVNAVKEKIKKTRNLHEHGKREGEGEGEGEGEMAER